MTRNKEGRVLYIVRYSDGWGWAFSPSNITAHGVLGFRVVGGELRQGEVVYLDTESNTTMVGSYNTMSGALAGFLMPGVSVRIKDCVPDISLPVCRNTIISLPFLVSTTTTRVRVALRELVVYNRVPKTGSQALLVLLKNLTKDTGRFRVHFPPTRWSLCML